MDVTLRPETTADHNGIRDVNRLAFGREAEAVLVDALRAGGFVRLLLVAEKDGKVVGLILFSDLPIVTGDGLVPALALAPMWVLPQYQRQGIGSALIRRGLVRPMNYRSSVIRTRCQRRLAASAAGARCAWPGACRFRSWASLRR